MEIKKYQTIILKIGTNVITREDGLLDLKIMKELVRQVVELRKKGIGVIVVSSGAMGAGRGMMEVSKKTKDIARRQVLAAVGQVELVHTYQKLFAEHKMLCAQVLATKEDFRDRGHYLNMKNCLESLLSEKVIPIINENDVVSVDELMFTDNDQLAALLASMMQADALILLTLVDGILDKDSGKVIPEVASIRDVEAHLSSGKSSFGRGGMITKCKVAGKLAALGIPTHIVNGQKKNIVIDLMTGKALGTKVLARKKRASSLKQWLAHAEGEERGMVVVDTRAETVLTDPEKTASLLPVGVTKIKHDFKKGDIIRVENEAGRVLGYGVAQYSSKTARDFKGKQGKKALIHYDTLYIHG